MYMYCCFGTNSSCEHVNMIQNARINFHKHVYFIVPHYCHYILYNIYVTTTKILRLNVPNGKQELHTS